MGEAQKAVVEAVSADIPDEDDERTSQGHLTKTKDAFTETSLALYDAIDEEHEARGAFKDAKETKAQTDKDDAHAAEMLEKAQEVSDKAAAVDAEAAAKTKAEAADADAASAKESADEAAATAAEAKSKEDAATQEALAAITEGTSEIESS